MSIGKFSRLLSVKYAAQLLSPHMTGTEKDAVLRNNIAELYRRFMPDYNGIVSQIKEVYDLPFLEAVHTVFARLVADLDSLDNATLKARCIEVVQKIQEARTKLADFVKLNKDDPAFVAFFMRKRLASTLEKTFTELSSDLIKNMGRIEMKPSSDISEEAKATVPSATEMLKSRKRMTQTPAQIENFVLRFGDLYGVEDMLDWGKIQNRDHDLAFELMTAFLGLNRAARTFNKEDYYDPSNPRHGKKELELLRKKEIEFLKSKVKLDLKRKVLELLGRKV